MPTSTANIAPADLLRYDSALHPVFREIAGYDDPPDETYDRFIHFLLNNRDHRQLLADIEAGGAKPQAISEAYREFLNKGEGCREGSVARQGFLRNLRPKPLADSQISLLEVGGAILSLENGLRIVFGLPRGAEDRGFVRPDIIIPASGLAVVDGIPRMVPLAAHGPRLWESYTSRQGPDKESAELLRMDDYTIRFAVGRQYKGDHSTAHEFAARMKDLVKAKGVSGYKAAWDVYQKTFLERAGLAALWIKHWHKQDNVARAVEAVVDLDAFWRGSIAFAGHAELKDAPDYVISIRQMASLNNTMAPVRTFVQLHKEWKERDALDELADIITGLEKMFHPFAHLRRTYPDDPQIETRVRITLPDEGSILEGPWNADMRNSVALRFILDEIVTLAYAMADDKRIALDFQWNEGRRAIRVRPSGMSAREFIIESVNKLAASMLPKTTVDLAPDDKSALEIRPVFLSSHTAPPQAGPAVVVLADRETQEFIRNSFPLRLPGRWGGLDESQRVHAVASVAWMAAHAALHPGGLNPGAFVLATDAALSGMCVSSLFLPRVM